MSDRTIYQHDKEIRQNLNFWKNKPILHTIYRDFYRLIHEKIDYTLEGKIVELGSGIGNIKMEIPQAICTDLFKNPWIDQVENAYALSFKDGEVSNLILFDVFHHIQFPGTAFKEFFRVLRPGGRIIIIDPAMSLTGFLVYGLFHHEPIGWFKRIQWDAPSTYDPWAIDYYAAQGNVEKIFFLKKYDQSLSPWGVIYGKKYSALSYILSGGYSKPQLYPNKLYFSIKRIEKLLDYFPWLFGTRALIVLRKK